MFEVQLSEFQTINNLVDALETLYDRLVAIENDDHATRIRGFLIGLLHTDEFSLSNTDPNHPYTRFAKRNDIEGNRQRLFQAMQELITDTNSELQHCIDLMFDSPSSEPCTTAVTDILQKYRSYVVAQNGDATDSDSDSVSSW